MGKPRGIKVTGKAAKRRGKSYRIARNSKRRKVNDFDPDNPEGNIRQEQRIKRDQEKRGLNSKPKSENFVPKSFKNLMVQVAEIKEKETAPTDDGLSKQQRKKNKKQKQLEEQQQQLQQQQQQSAAEKKLKGEDKVLHHKVLQQKQLVEKMKLIQQKEKDIESMAENSKLTKRQLKNKMHSKMKKEKERMKKIKKQLSALTASERSGSRKRKRDSDKTIVLDDEDDVIDPDDLLDVNVDEDDLDIEETFLKKDTVEFGEVAQEPPKKLRKLQEKLERKIKRKPEVTLTAEERQMEAIKNRQMEQMREKVLKNYNDARLKRYAGVDKSEGDKEAEKWQNFAATAGNKKSL